MNKQVVTHLLDALDKAANSNSFWLELGIPKGLKQPDVILLEHLRTGSFHHKLIVQDLERGWDNYYEVVYPKATEVPFKIPLPGNTWNGNSQLTYAPLDTTQLSTLLVDLLTGQQQHFSKSSAGTSLTSDAAQTLVEDFVTAIHQASPHWIAYRFACDFLHSVQDYFQSGYLQPGYFEKAGRDLALAFHAEDTLSILLCNGYQ